MEKSKIYTKKGDKGTTQLGNKTRVRKNHPIIEAVGTLDELNCFIGMAKLLEVIDVKILNHIQNDLFNIGSYLSNHEQVILLGHLEEGTKDMEDSIDIKTETMDELHNFILPGGSEKSVRYHLARAVSRRAERAISKAASIEEIDPRVLQYINRISDYLFTMARYSNYKLYIVDVVWKK